jgi:hypothetical protein
MQLSIIVPDSAVYENGLSYSPLTWNGTPPDVHALQFDTDTNSGWIEYVSSANKPNEDITVLPDWANNAMAAWQVAYDEAHKPPVPVPPTAEENKAMAISLLQQTDWTQIPSVSDPALSNPYLANKLDFDQYRNAVRQYAVYPVAGNITWPTIPTETWVKV